jgi:hypothetical protein
MGSVAVFLVLSGRIRLNRRLALRLLVASMRPRFSGELRSIDHDEQHCYIAPLDPWLVSDRDGRSSLVLFEDDRPLPHPHARHDDIRAFGGGRYSHWGNQVFFSSLDNSDPCSNGRRYTARETR